MALGRLMAATALTALCTAQLTGPAGAPASAAANCAIHPLPLPPGALAGSVDGAGPDGTLTGYATTGVNPPDGAAMLWRDGRIAATVPHAPGALLDLNTAGDGVGDSVDGQSRHHPWILHGGIAHRRSGEGTAHAIGERGQLVGGRLTGTGNGPPVEVPATWPAGAQDPVNLPMPGNETGTATDIAADGTIVGTVGTNAYLWHPDGTGAMLPRPPGVPATEIVRADAISGHFVVGSAPTVGVVRWDLTTGTVATVPGLTYGDQNRVNAAGTVLGEHGYAAVTVTGGTPVTLPSLGPGYLNVPAALSADGRVAGGMTQTNQNPSPLTEKPVYWTCP